MTEEEETGREKKVLLVVVFALCHFWLLDIVPPKHSHGVHGVKKMSSRRHANSVASISISLEVKP